MIFASLLLPQGIGRGFLTSSEKNESGVSLFPFNGSNRIGQVDRVIMSLGKPLVLPVRLEKV
jgi:hypothetical protein